MHAVDAVGRRPPRDPAAQLVCIPRRDSALSYGEGRIVTAHAKADMVQRKWVPLLVGGGCETVPRFFKAFAALLPAEMSVGPSSEPVVVNRLVRWGNPFGKQCNGRENIRNCTRSILVMCVCMFRLVTRSIVCVANNIVIRLNSLTLELALAHLGKISPKRIHYHLPRN